MKSKTKHTNHKRQKQNDHSIKSCGVVHSMGLGVGAHTAGFQATVLPTLLGLCSAQLSSPGSCQGSRFLFLLSLVGLPRVGRKEPSICSPAPSWTPPATPHLKAWGTQCSCRVGLRMGVRGTGSTRNRLNSAFPSQTTCSARLFPEHWSSGWPRAGLPAVSLTTM